MLQLHWRNNSGIYNKLLLISEVADNWYCSKRQVIASSWKMENISILFSKYTAEQSSKVEFSHCFKIIALACKVLLVCEQLNDYHLVTIIPVFSILFLSWDFKAIFSRGQPCYSCFIGQIVVQDTQRQNCKGKNEIKLGSNVHWDRLSLTHSKAHGERYIFFILHHNVRGWSKKQESSDSTVHIGYREIIFGIIKHLASLYGGFV